MIKPIYMAVIVLLGLAFGVGSLLFYQPRWLLAVLAERSDEVLYYVDTSEPLVALTIDDGPDRRTTGAILRVLAEHDVKATFFLVAERVAGNGSVVAQIAEEGHEIGNHMTREERSIELTPEEFERSLLAAHRTLSRFAQLRWMRPGSGWYNERMLSTIATHGYRCALASIYPYDATLPSRNFAVWHILLNVRRGAVIALHDGGDRGARTAEVLERVLPELQRRGYRVVTLGGLVAAGKRPSPARSLLRSSG
ncbi:MAG: chitin deacetylase family protein [Gemmatimonadales bacterium]|jgi:peptidoglycan/xylan/chitin deacetylase (PgdA/CDA1 family)